MNAPKQYKPNADALPSLLDTEKEAERIRSIEAHKEQLRKEREATRTINALLFKQ